MKLSKPNFTRSYKLTNESIYTLKFNLRNKNTTTKRNSTSSGQEERNPIVPKRASTRPTTSPSNTPRIPTVETKPKITLDSETKPEIKTSDSLKDPTTNIATFKTEENVIILEKTNIKEGLDINLKKNYPKDTGYDLQANIDNPIVLGANQRAIINTGLKIEIPEQLDVQIRPRSGLALTKGLTVLNPPGTIDSGFQGEIKVILINLGQNEIIIEPGMRIAQMTFTYKAPVIIKEGTIHSKEEIHKELRQDKGFGSSDTGKQI